MTGPETKDHGRLSPALSSGTQTIVDMAVATTVAMTGGAVAAACVLLLHMAGLSYLFALATAPVIGGVTICLLLLVATTLMGQPRSLTDLPACEAGSEPSRRALR